ncbi:uncharacterized protein BX663DRAFT_571874 [Cokeromyces recurvatus]|uniref:uncharacterized protein n=1 Tax=Cokeromyces recurvatus TaxID=90255 RepID=UPI002220FB5F|nr:uncharacterized protein BX663DRAFT_571874 [Cokeromyces recurvatus]KAI7901293.1 hypothetical protein BX663DRAFT_571874 [Cokeromyces recurvatus]
MNGDPNSSITARYKEYIECLINQGPQLLSEDIIEELAKQFWRLNHYLKNKMKITINPPSPNIKLKYGIL